MYLMKYFKIVLGTVLMLFITTAVMAKDGVKADKITLAEETTKIIPSPDIPDPNRPKLIRNDGNFMVTFFDKKSKSWDYLGNVVRINSEELKNSKNHVRLVVDDFGTIVFMEKLKYWPGVEWQQPIATIFRFEADKDVPYEILMPGKADGSKYRLLICRGNKRVCVPVKDLLAKDEPELHYQCVDDREYVLKDTEPMSYLAKVYAYWTAKKNKDVREIRSMYWRTIATGWSMVMGNTAKLDKDGYYHSTEWFFDEFAYAMYPKIDWPDLIREDHVLWFAERSEPYVIRRRTFDVNLVDIVKQRREEEQFIVTMRVKGMKKEKLVDIYMTPADRYKHPFEWKIDKGVIL